MKSFFAFLFTISAVLVQAQNIDSALPSYGVYKSAADYATQNITDGFSAKDKDHKLRDEVTHRVYIDNNATSHVYPYDSIWGFRRAGDDWRIYNNRIYKVVQSGKAVVYIRPTKTDMSVPGLTRFETTYFSAAPDSPVYPLTQENLLLAFRNNTSMVSKVSSLRPSYSVTKKDKGSGTYEFINWL